MPFVTLAEASLIDEAHPLASTEETVNLDWQVGEENNDHSIGEAIEGNGAQIAALREALDEVQHSLDKRTGTLEDHESTLEGLQSTVEEATETIQSDHDAIGGLNERVAQLEEEREVVNELTATLDAVESKVDQLVDSLESVEARTGNHGENLAVLRTAVFNESHPCPECRTGTLGLKTPVARPKRVTCDSCEFKISTEIS